MGPLVNLAAAAIFGLAYTALSAAGIRAFVINDFNLLPWAIFIALWLGAFNMIPFCILDGQKVLTWNRAIWALVTIPLWLATAAALILQLSSLLGFPSQDTLTKETVLLAALGTCNIVFLFRPNVHHDLFSTVADERDLTLSH